MRRLEVIKREERFDRVIDRNNQKSVDGADEEQTIKSARNSGSPYFHSKRTSAGLGGISELEKISLTRKELHLLPKLRSRHAPAASQLDHSS